VKHRAFVITLISSLIILSSVVSAQNDTISDHTPREQAVGDAQMLTTIEPRADFITLSPDQTLLFASYSKQKSYHPHNQGWLKVWRLNSGHSLLVWEWRLSGYSINQMAVSPDGQTLAAVCSDAATRLWHAQTSKFLRAIRPARPDAPGKRAPATTVAYAPDGQTLAIGGGVNKPANADPQDPNSQSMIQLLSARTTRLQHTFFVLGDPAVMRFAPDSRRIAIGCYTSIENQVAGRRAWGAGGYVGLWDAATGQQGSRLQKSEFYQMMVPGLFFSSDGSVLGAVGAELALLWNVADGSIRTRPNIGGANRPGSVALSGDGKLVAIGSGVGIRIYDAQSGELQQTLVAKGYITFIAFSRDNIHLIAADFQGAVRSWQVK